ncbi:MAG: carboxypeptidase regulatory-like domain-containing protein, partial [Alphaproteobacteria bacterium]
VTNQNSDTVPSGDVISQSPAAGASVAPGSAVDLVVSSGAGPGGGTGRIKGTVRDSSGSTVKGALVEIQAQAMSTTTNKRGKYRLRDVPAGSHTLTASKNGCAQDIPVIVVDGDTLRVDVALPCLP